MCPRLPFLIPPRTNRNWDIAAFFQSVGRRRRKLVQQRYPRLAGDKVSAPLVSQLNSLSVSVLSYQNFLRILSKPSGPRQAQDLTVGKTPTVDA